MSLVFHNAGGTGCPSRQRSRALVIVDFRLKALAVCDQEEWQAALAERRDRYPVSVPAGDAPAA